MEQHLGTGVSLDFLHLVRRRLGFSIYLDGHRGQRCPKTSFFDTTGH